MSYIGEIIDQRSKIDLIELELRLDKAHEFFGHQPKYNEEDEKIIESINVPHTIKIKGETYYLPHWQVRKDQEIAFLYLKYGNKNIN